MDDDGVGLAHQAQMVPAMLRLSARLLATLGTQALGLAGKPVAGRRFATVVAVFGQPPLQVLHTGHQRSHLLTQRGILGFEGGMLCLEFLPCQRHVFSLATARNPYLSSYVNS